MNPDSPYFIHTTPAAIAFSGGRTSGYMLAKILEAHDGKLPADTIVTFQNTGEEVEATYEFIHEVGQRWTPVVWLEFDEDFNIEKYRKADGKLMDRRCKRDLSDPKDLGLRIVDFRSALRNGEPFDRMLKYFWDYRKAVKGEGPILPTRVTRQCTSQLKIKLQDRYMRHLGYDPYEQYTGIRYDEPRRWAKLADLNNRSNHYITHYPMVGAGVVRQDVLDFWATQSFDLDLDPLAEEGNCRLCFLKKTDRITRILRKLIEANNGQPDEEVKRWLRREEESGMLFRNDRPSIAKLVQIASAPGEVQDTPDEEEIDCICGSPSV